MTTKLDIDRAFYEKAKNELAKSGTSATAFFQQHPACSKKKLAQLIGNGVTSRGLTMMLLEEAKQHSSVRSVAQDLLYREILDEFPNGWFEDDTVRATVKVGGWQYDVFEFSPEFADRATAVLRALATTDKPEKGWRPDSPEDDRIMALFSKHWEPETEHE